jgi:pilus assembly protein CpaB
MLTDTPGDIGSAGSDAALQIPEGRVAYALPVARYSSVAWAIQPGDHVDVLVSLRMVDLDEEFQTILPNQFSCATESEACQGGVLGRLEALPNGWVANVIPSEGQRPGLVTQLTVQDSLVLRVGDWRDPSPAPPPEEGEEVTPTPVPQVLPLTLAVTPQQALVLKYAQEAGASMDLVLRSPRDADRELETESVTLEYLLEQYGIEQPAKLPYGTQGAGSRD